MSDYKGLVQRQLGEIAAARAGTAAPLAPRKSAEEFLGLPFTPGARVVDTLTGQAGTVQSATIQHVIEAAESNTAAPQPTPFFNLPSVRNICVVTVLLDDGSLVKVDPHNLIKLPASLTLPLAHLEPVK